MHDALILLIDVVLRAVLYSLVALFSPIFVTIYLWKSCTRRRRHFKSILITGANSGIGQALAIAFAKPGVALALTGRKADTLKAVEEQCKALGAEVHSEVIDVQDGAGMKDFINEMDARVPIDLVIANAGVSGGMSGHKYLEEQTYSIFSVNVDGALNTLLPLYQKFRSRRSGQIAVVSSLMANFPNPYTAAYQASKAALLSYGKGLRLTLAPLGIGVSVVCPGFVESRATTFAKNSGVSMPFLLTGASAAAIIKDGLERNAYIISFPSVLAVGSGLLSCLPPALMEFVFRFMPNLPAEQGLRELS
eukprot:GILJ01003633.1.p1 GENE.GILJ01003633.1~~GILJ01003633.1.p1  ORF type:complete len:306 (+),score=35.92 GILJ01003633.1:41-958(+)